MQASPQHHSKALLHTARAIAYESLDKRKQLSSCLSVVQTSTTSLTESLGGQGMNDQRQRGTSCVSDMAKSSSQCQIVKPKSPRATFGRAQGPCQSSRNRTSSSLPYFPDTQLPDDQDSCNTHQNEENEVNSDKHSTHHKVWDPRHDHRVKSKLAADFGDLHLGTFPLHSPYQIQCLHYLGHFSWC